MRRYVDRDKLFEVMREIGRRAQTRGTIYLTGGATALLLGVRSQTVDIDIKMDPEPGGIFQAIADLKVRLAVNMELAAPDQFIPPLPGWQERSQYIDTFGLVEFRHYDFYGQALAKIERGYTQDLADADALLDRELIRIAEVEHFYNEIRGELIKYPGIDSNGFDEKVSAFVVRHRNE
jgi:hypothetical protein